MKKPQSPSFWQVRQLVDASRIDIQVIIPADSGQAGMTNMGAVFLVPMLQRGNERGVILQL